MHWKCHPMCDIMEYWIVPSLHDQAWQWSFYRFLDTVFRLLIGQFAFFPGAIKRPQNPERPDTSQTHNPGRWHNGQKILRSPVYLPRGCSGGELFLTDKIHFFVSYGENHICIYDMHKGRHICSICIICIRVLMQSVVSKCPSHCCLTPIVGCYWMKERAESFLQQLLQPLLCMTGVTLP